MKTKLAPMSKVLAPIAVLALGLAACGTTESTSASEGQSTTTAPTTESPTSTEAPVTNAPANDVEEDVPVDQPGIADDAPVFVWTETGGCMQAGPNCARYVVTADGNVTTYRGDSDEIAATGVVSELALADWLTATSNTDVVALVERAGPGEMTAAFDGVDFLLDAPHTETSLSSVDLEFSPSEDYFAAAIALASSAADAAPLEIGTR